MPYQRNPREALDVWRSRVELAWLARVGPVPIVRTRGRKVKTRIAELTDMASTLDELGELVEPWSDMNRKAGGSHWAVFRPTRVGLGTRDLMIGQFGYKEGTAYWLAQAYLEALTLIPKSAPERTWMQVRYLSADPVTGKKNPINTRTYRLSPSSKPEDILPYLAPIEEADEEYGSDMQEQVVGYEVDPNFISIVYMPERAMGGVKRLKSFTTSFDGDIVKDYEGNEGTCLVVVANHMGGKQIQRPGQWCKKTFPGWDKHEGLPVKALDQIEAVTGVSLPVVDIETHELLRRASPALPKGKGIAIGYDSEEHHFVHIVQSERLKQTFEQIVYASKEKVKNKRRVVVAYDYETIHERMGSVTPYCLSWACIEVEREGSINELPTTYEEFEAYRNAGRAGIVYGEDCSAVFLQWLAESEYIAEFGKVTLEAFNGSRFDASILAKVAHMRGVLCPKSLLIVGGGLLQGSIKGGIAFHDMRRFLVGSLAECCASFGVKRMKVGGFDHHEPQNAHNEGRLVEWCNENGKKLSEYSAFDVLALAELSYKVYHAFKKCPGEPNVFKYPTIGSLAMKSLKKEHKKNGTSLPESPRSAEDEAIMRSAMTAGRVQVMRGRGKVKGRLYMLDIASSYPYTMLNHEYPSGSYKETDEEVPGKMGIYKCRIRSQPKITIVPLRKKDKPLDWTYTGAQTATLTTVDINEIRKEGHQVDVEGGFYWEDSTKGNFAPVLRTLEAMKGEQDVYKRTKDSKYNQALREASKLYMNSLSGKVAQRAKKALTALSDDYETTCKALDELKPDTVELSLFGKSLLITGKKAASFNPKTATPCFLACFIYSYARQRLRAALKCGAYYCDTDSALMDEEGYRKFCELYPDWLTPPGKDKRFGEWEEELGQDGTKELEGYFVQPKNYAVFGPAGKKDCGGDCKRSCCSDSIRCKKCDKPCCVPKVRSKGVGSRDIVVSEDEAVALTLMNEKNRGEFAHQNKHRTIKDEKTARAVFEAGVESKPVYILCMQFRRICGDNSCEGENGLGGLFALKQVYTVKQINANEADKRRWESIRK